MCLIVLPTGKQPMHVVQYNLSIPITVCKQDEEEGKSCYSHSISQFKVYATQFHIPLCSIYLFCFCIIAIAV